MTIPGNPTNPNSHPTDAAACDSTVACCPLQNITRRENVIFIGSEMQYDSFWLKMMFMAAAHVTAHGNGGFRSADKNTIAYVNIGYTFYELLPLDYLRNTAGFNIVRLSSSRDITALINTRPQTVENGTNVTFLLQDVAFFSHGVPNTIKLNYNGSPDINFSASELASARRDAFVPDGRIYSYACRTGVSRWNESFSRDGDAGLDISLAQLMANHFRVEVHAFLKRTFYGDVLRERSDSSRISSALRSARATQEGSVIQIPPDHEALPHPGLANRGSSFFGTGPIGEGTNAYALWRKAGGIRLPSTGDTPSGLSSGMHRFTPQ